MKFFKPSAITITLLSVLALILAIEGAAILACWHVLHDFLRQRRG
jgi:hypothetical protein